MNLPASEKTPKFSSRVIWIIVLVMMIATSTHLLRTALRASENRAILIAGVVLLLCVIFKMGRMKTPTATEPSLRKRPYIPLSAVPILLLAVWAANARLFGAFDVSAVLFHIQHSLKYDGVGDDIAEFLGYFTFALILIACISYLARRDKRVVWIERIAAIGLLFMNPAMSYAYDRFINPDLTSLDLMETYETTEIIPETQAPKNLLIVYLESMEATFADPVFGDVFSDLNALSAEGLRLDGVRQINDTGWTIAGIAASQCGIPLLSYGLVMKNRIKNVEDFLPKADCLASRLADRGYQTRYLGGASLEFAGKGNFLRTHGYQKVTGLDEIPEAQRGDVNKWGIYDERLFELALAELESLSNAEAPYLMSVLTLDAHGPEGFPSPACYDLVENAETMDTMLLAVACTSKMARNFVETARNRGFLDNTVVVLMSDHLSHRNTQTARLDALERENFVLILGPEIEPGQHTKAASMIDLYPTLLDSIGLPTTTGKAGLGVSLLGPQDTLLQDYGVDSLNRAIRADQELREYLWDLEEPRSQTTDQTAENP